MEAMKNLTKALAKGAIGTVAAGAMVVSTAGPAFARDRDGGIDAGDVIAGALVIGGIAAIAAATSDNDHDRDYRYDNDYRYGRDGERDYDRYGYRNDNPRSAVEQCVRAAERTASRSSRGGRAKVTDIRNVDRKYGGYEVKGRIAVNRMGHDWRSGDRVYGNGWGGDYRGWNSGYRGYDSGRFTCTIRHGRVVDLDFRGIRGR